MSTDPESLSSDPTTSLHPLDLRWFINRCGLENEKRCGVEPDPDVRRCYGCVGGGFNIALSTVALVVEAHPEIFGLEDSLVRGPIAPKPWDPDCEF